jgi:outer membrane protein assembly factor BamB
MMRLSSRLFTRAALPVAGLAALIALPAASATAAPGAPRAAASTGGKTVWTITYSPGKGKELLGLNEAISPSGQTVYVIGQDPTSATAEGAVTLAYNTGGDSGVASTAIALNAKTGAKMWTVNAGAGIYGYAVAVSPNRPVVYVDGANFGTGTATGVAAYDTANGHPVWTRSYVRSGLPSGGSRSARANDAAERR